MSDLISVVIPVYNESTNIDEMVGRLGETFKRIPQSNFEIWFIDDGSSDTTLRKIKAQHKIDERVKCVSFSRNFGHHCAIAAGIDHASGAQIILMDGDLQDRPESIPALLKKLNEGYDIVCAQRSEQRGTWFKQLTSRLFWGFIKMSSGLDLVADQSIMRVFNRPVLESLKKIKESNRFYSALFNWVGFRKTGLEVQYDDRSSGETKYSFRKRLKLAMDAIFGFGQFPLWLLLALGLALIVLGTFTELPVVALGNPAIVLGVFSIIFGVAAYQVRQGLRDSRERPLYIVREVIE